MEKKKVSGKVVTLLLTILLIFGGIVGGTICGEYSTWDLSNATDNTYGCPNSKRVNKLVVRKIRKIRG